MSCGAIFPSAFYTGIDFAFGTTWEVVLRAECSKMTLSISGQSFVVSNRVTFRPVNSLVRADEETHEAIKSNDPSHRWTVRRVEAKKRISTLIRLIADFDRMASELDQEVRIEENRVKVHDPADIAYSIYAKATASRRDNLRRSAEELRGHVADSERSLDELGEVALDG
jgi:hypothetical protein